MNQPQLLRLRLDVKKAQDVMLINEDANPAVIYKARPITRRLMAWLVRAQFEWENPCLDTIASPTGGVILFMIRVLSSIGVNENGTTTVQLPTILITVESTANRRLTYHIECGQCPELERNKGKGKVYTHFKEVRERCDRHTRRRHATIDHPVAELLSKKKDTTIRKLGPTSPGRLSRPASIRIWL